MRSAKKCHDWLLGMLFLVLLIPLSLSSQTASGYSCAGAVQVSVDASCQYIVDPKTLLQGDSIPDNLKVFVFDRDPSNREIVECPGTYNYSITNERNAIICWGMITLVDDQGPLAVDTIQTLDTLECSQLNRVLNNPNTILPVLNGAPNPYYLGEVIFEENCSSCNCEMTVKFFDQVDFLSCDSLPYYAKITRRWTASDCKNNLNQVEQYFYLIRPPFEKLQLIPDQEIATCSPQEVSIPDQYPFWIDVFGDTLFLNDLDCNLDVQLIEQSLTNCEGLFQQIQRQVQVFDWCTGDTSIVDRYQVNIGDFTAPQFSEKAINLEAPNNLEVLNQEYQREQLLRLGQEGMVTEISLGPMDCTVSFPLDQDFLQEQFGYQIEDCSTSGYRYAFYSLGNSEEWSYSSFNNAASGVGTNVNNVPPGMHALIIEANDDCGNTGKGLLLFFVRDRIAPVARCIEDLSVPIEAKENGLFYQTVSIDAIDQNSTDNCQLVQREIRREVPRLEEVVSTLISLGFDSDQNGIINELDYIDSNQNGRQDSDESNWSFENGKWYTPWTDQLFFFCSEVNTQLEVQARFFDQATAPLSGVSSPNMGQCWTEVSVLDTSRMRLSNLPNVELDCDDPIVSQLQTGSYSFPEDSLLLRAFRQNLGYPEITGNICGQFTVKEVINRSLDNCGFGDITRTIIVEKPTGDGSYSVSEQQTITIREQYDYWIKFPKDIQANCSEVVVDSGYLEVAEEHCDLLAISYTDDYFFAPQDIDACFKIFRTYQVINWCEYNGSSDPVIVSRDWDTWNGGHCGTDFNINPTRPDGNNQPGDSDLFVIVNRNFNDNLPDTVYYDVDSNPHNNHPDNPQTPNHREGYWWKVLSGSGSIESPGYYQSPYFCDQNGQTLENVWGDAPSDSQADNSQHPRFGSFGYWQYTQHLLIYDDIFPVVELSGSTFICGETNDDCLVEVQLGMTVTDQCLGSKDLELEIWFDENRDGISLADYSSALNNDLFNAYLPVGNHRLVLWADDNCGNRVQQTFDLNIQDCSAPQPICRPGLIIELNPNDNGGATASALASDFIATATYDCAGQGPEEDDKGRLLIQDYSINLKDAPVDRSQSGISFTCSQLTAPEFLVEIHAWDENNQHGFCESIINIRGGDEACPQANGMIAGTIITEDNRSIQNADVNLSGPMSMLYLSDENGKYSFENIETNNDYTVSPSLNSGFLNGISTRDILIIQNHILGRQALDSPYKLIAADVNNSKAISTLDLIELRKLILSIDLRFKHNTSWRFIPAQFDFPDPENPWGSFFPEIINVNNLEDSLKSADFIGIKIGDVSGNVDPATTLSIDERSLNSTNIYFPDLTLLPGQTYQIPIEAKLEELQGMQFTMGIDPGKAEIIEILPAAFSKNHFRIQKERGWLATSWLQTETSMAKLKGQICFHLVLRVEEKVRLEEILSLTDYWLTSEGYTNDRVISLELEPRNSLDNKDEPVLRRAFPNPFSEVTQIIIDNPTPQKIKCQVFSLTGQLIKQWVQDYGTGKQRIPIFSDQLPVKGIYLVKIKSKNSEQSHRIVYQ